MKLCVPILIVCARPVAIARAKASGNLSGGDEGQRARQTAPREPRMARERARDAIRQQRATRFRIRRHGRDRADRLQDIDHQLLRLFVVRQERQIASVASFNKQRHPLVAVRMAAKEGAAIELQSHPTTQLPPGDRGRHRMAGENGATRICLRLKTQDAPDAGTRWIGQKPAHDFRDRVDVSLRHGAVVRQLQRQTGARANLPCQLRESLAHRMKIYFTRQAIDREPVPAGLRHVDVDRDLAQPAVNHQRLEKLGMLEQRLAVSHEHRHQADRDRVPHDLDQLFLPSAPPIGIGHIAARDLESTTRSLKAAIGFDLLRHFSERRDGNFVGILWQVAMRAAEGAIARAGDESTMGEMAAGELVRRAQLVRQRFPAGPQECLLFRIDRETKCTPAVRPLRAMRLCESRAGGSMPLRRDELPLVQSIQRGCQPVH